MPITIDKAPDTLPQKAKEIYVATWNSAYDGTCKDSENRDECASKVAWGSVKRKYAQDGDTWKPKSELAQFSLAIVKASFDKATQEYRWRAVASDTDDDLYGDNMSVTLFDGFLQRIEDGTIPPEDYVTEAWAGGMPYISISHYPDLNGKGIPGEIRSIYRDGNRLKGTGVFFNDALGKACFDSVCKSLYGDEEDKEHPVRLSIAFLDYEHRHKETNTVFTRSEVGEVCEECFRSMLTGKSNPKEYLDGHLIHWALTRVPVNPRTAMDAEMERSMNEIKTRKDDAASIVGDELAEILDNENELVGKSQTMVIKSETDETEEPVQDEQETTDSLPTETLEDVPEVVEELSVADNEVREDVVDMNAVLEKLELLSQTVEKLVNVEEPEAHILDGAFAKLKSVYDAQSVLDVDGEEKLRSMQEPFEELAHIMRSSFEGEIVETSEPVSDISQQIASALAPLAQKLDELLSTRSQATQVVPERRSLSLQPNYQNVQSPRKSTMSIEEIVKSTVY
jgi:cation transport regulator ChaB